MQSKQNTFKGVQRGTITIASGSTSNTATISSVNTAKAGLSNLGVIINPVANVHLCDAFVSLSLTNSTTITATRGGNGTTNATGATTVTVSFEVYEYY